MSTTSLPGKAAATPATSRNVEILQTQASQLYASVHPILLLSLLLASFKALVRDPVNTLLGLTPIVAILQAVYCVLCLPYSGTASNVPPKPGQKKKAQKPAQEILARLVV